MFPKISTDFVGRVSKISIVINPSARSIFKSVSTFEPCSLSQFMHSDHWQRINLWKSWIFRTWFLGRTMKREMFRNAAKTIKSDALNINIELLEPICVNFLRKYRWNRQMTASTFIINWAGSFGPFQGSPQKKDKFLEMSPTCEMNLLCQTSRTKD